MSNIVAVFYAFSSVLRQEFLSTQEIQYLRIFTVGVPNETLVVFHLEYNRTISCSCQENNLDLRMNHVPSYFSCSLIPVNNYQYILQR